MKIIIGNHIESSLLTMSKDDRIFSQRVLWFAEEGDMIILSAEPDMDFLEYVCSLTGVNPASLKLHIPPEGRFHGKHFDPYSLTDKTFLGEISENLDNVTRILPMWPSPSVALFAEKLGLSDKLPGAKFFSQNGVELVNNKAYFRVLATTANIPIAPGEVCHDIEDAALAIERHLTNTGAVMVKQVHNGAGAGNELLIRNPSLQIDYVGARFIQHLNSNSSAIRDYLGNRWSWASAQERRPVVIEEFKPRSQTIYAEFYADESGIRHTQAGRLGYTERRLTIEIAPLRGVSDDIRIKLITYGERLAKIYHAIGYRGFLSADALVDDKGELIFTEMNARVGGSLHIYDSIAGRVVNATRKPERTIIQYHAPLTWVPVDFEGFLATVKELGCLYNPANRKGVIISLPIILEIGGYVSFCIVYENESEEKEIFEKLDARLRQDNFIESNSL